MGGHHCATHRGTSSEYSHASAQPSKQLMAKIRRNWGGGGSVVFRDDIAQNDHIYQSTAKFFFRSFNIGRNLKLVRNRVVKAKFGVWGQLRKDKKAYRSLQGISRAGLAGHLKWSLSGPISDIKMRTS